MNFTPDSMRSQKRKNVSTFRELSLLWILFIGVSIQTKTQSVEDPFTFVAIGDAGYPGVILEQNATTLRSLSKEYQENNSPLDALVFLGDNFYPIGLNHDSTERERLLDKVLRPHAGTLISLGQENVHAVPGNHDYYCATLGPIPYGTCNTGNTYEAAIPFWTYHLEQPGSARYAVSSESSDSIELIFINSCHFLLNETNLWKGYLDTVEQILEASKRNTAVKWRLLFAHHSPFSVGPHGGYRTWNKAQKKVTYRGCCVEDGEDPIKYVERLAGYHEDNCDPVYVAYRDSLFNVIARTKATVHATFAGHDHSLQLLAQRDRPLGIPGVFIISGAGSKQTRVGSPRTDPSVGMSIYSHPQNNEQQQGKSIYGFVAGTVEEDRLKLWFVDGATGKKADMGDASEFFIDSSGTLVETR